MHPPFAECYAIQAFHIASNLDPKLVPEEQDQIEKSLDNVDPLFQGVMGVDFLAILAVARMVIW